jgi:putative colanic acid biosynthesis acetyltransferase WcaF
MNPNHDVSDSATDSYPHLAHFTTEGYDKGRNIAWQASWFAVQNLLFGAWWVPGRARPWILRAFGAKIGTGTVIRHRVRVLWPWKLSVGDSSWIGEDAWLLNLEPIAIGSDVCVSQGAFLCTGSHDHRTRNFQYDNAPITVEDGVWIAAQAVILRGTTIGRGALVGARAIVKKDVKSGEIVPVNQVH